MLFRSSDNETFAEQTHTLVIKESWWTEKPDDKDLELTKRKIFTARKQEILLEHLPRFMELKGKQRGHFTEKTILKEIREFWGDRFSTSALRAGGETYKLWQKKKEASIIPQFSVICLHPSYRASRTTCGTTRTEERMLQLRA